MCERPGAKHTGRGEAEEGGSNGVDSRHNATVPFSRAGVVESMKDKVKVCPEEEAAQGSVEVIRRATFQEITW